MIRDRAMMRDRVRSAFILTAFAASLSLACSSACRSNSRRGQGSVESDEEDTQDTEGTQDTHGTLSSSISLRNVTSAETPAVGRPGEIVPTGTILPTETDAPLPQKNQRSSLGTNLTYLKDYSGEWPFVDAFKQSRSWISGRNRTAFGQATWDDRRALDVDEHGWIRSLSEGQIARTLFFWANKRVAYPGGDYVVLFDGQGTIEYAHARVRDKTPGREVILVDPNQGGFGLNIVATNPNDYIRNIRVLMPGGVCSNDAYRWCETDSACSLGSGSGSGSGGSCVLFERTYASQVFHPNFLDRIKTYHSLRFMDWMATNDSAVSLWADRPKLTDARWTEKGAPLEIMVDLANRLKAGAWFTIPHRATDDYVTHFANYLFTHLDRDLRIYVEHSNEVWNAQFAQSKFAQVKGLELKLTTDPWEAVFKYHSRRSVEIFRIFEAVLGGKPRLTRVMGSHIGNSWLSDQLLKYQDAAKHTDAIAIAYYFGGHLGHPREEARVRSMTLDGLFQDLRTEHFKQVGDWVDGHLKVAKHHSVELLAYEGGEHLVGVAHLQEDPAVNALFDAAGRDPRMKAIYLQYLDAWKEKGGGLFMHFVNCAANSQHGRFGALEDLRQPRERAPKFDALQEFIEKNPRWW